MPANQDVCIVKFVPFISPKLLRYIIEVFVLKIAIDTNVNGFGQRLKRKEWSITVNTFCRGKEKVPLDGFTIVVFSSLQGSALLLCRT